MCMIIATSWDDGLISDYNLLKILNKYGIKASFALTTNRHNESILLNDVRSHQFGYLVPINSWHIYNNHDICSHTHSHIDVSKCDASTITYELQHSKLMLESIFNQNIDCIVWPYGVYTNESELIAADIGYKLGRTTHKNGCDNTAFTIKPFSYGINLDIVTGTNKIILYGHTYEIDNWDFIDDLYYKMMKNKKITLTTISELIKYG